MISFKRALPALVLLAASATANAQSAPPVAAIAVDPPAAEAPPELFFPPETHPFASPPPAVMSLAERSDVVAVRREITALRLACAVMPPHTYVESYLLPPRGSQVASPSLMSRPFAAEEDTCAAVLNPDQAGPGYAIELGMIGAGLTLFALMFFTVIGGVLRVLWHGPIARALPTFFARRFHG